MNELHADSIFHSFGTRKILSGVFLTMKTGEIVGLLGRNGSGKSTLLQIMFGTLAADQGVIKVNDVYQKRLYRKKLAAYLPQCHFLPKDLTVGAIVSLYAESKGDEEDVLSDANIAMLRTKKVRELSGGTARYLEVVLMLSLHRPFIFLDEPFSGLSPMYHEHIREHLMESRKDKGIIVTDHGYRNIVDVSDRLMLL